MKFDKPLSIEWIADFIGAEIIGDVNNEALGINEIHKVIPGDITFVDFEKYYNKCLSSAATVILINKKVDAPEGKTLLYVQEPFDAYIKIVTKFRQLEPSSQLISEDVVVGNNTIIQPGTFIGKNCKIGNNCIIHANVTIYDHTIIEDNVIIHSGAVIGSEAFYYKGRKDTDIKYIKMESCGDTWIQAYVEIGACTTIDKGVSGTTIIGKGTKIDNHCHIGHGVEIGKNCLIAAQVGIAGKTIIEDNVTLWGQVGVNKDLRIGEGAVVLAQSGVPASIEGGKTYFGSPVEDAKLAMKKMSWIKVIPELWKKVHTS